MPDTTQGYVPTEIVKRCRHRDAYATMRDAQQAAQALNTTRPPFRCPSCRLWHLRKDYGPTR